MADNIKKVKNNLLYKIAFFTYLLTNLVLNIVRHCNFIYDDKGLEWQSIEMIMSYRYGFVRRGLMGSVALILSKIFGTDRYNTIKFIQLAGEIVFCALIIVLVVYLIRLCKNETQQNVVIFLSAVFLQLAGFGLYLYDWGEPDIYMVSLTIIAVMLILSKRCVFLVIPISCICEMIHEGYALMFFPVIFALLFYCFCTEKDKKEKRKYFIILFLTTLFTAVLFFYFYFFSTPIKNFTAEEVLNEFNTVYKKKLPEMLDKNVRYIWLGAENYALPLWKNGEPTFMFFDRMDAFKLSIIVTFPCLAYFLLIWFTRALNFKKNEHKWAELALFFSIAVVVPLFIVHSDIARWCYAFVFYEFVILAVITIRDGDGTVRFFEKFKLLNNWFVKLAFACFIIAETFMIRCEKWNILDISLIDKAYHSVLELFH